MQSHSYVINKAVRGFPSAFVASHVRVWDVPTLKPLLHLNPHTTPTLEPFTGHSLI